MPPEDAPTPEPGAAAQPASPDQIPPEARPPTEGVTPPGQGSYRAVLRLRNFRRLWIGMTVSSLGDWIGLFALLSITNRLAPQNTLAVAGLMIFRMLPAFLVGPVAGVLLDRVDRRKAMIVSDLIRAGIIASIPFVDTLPGLYAISFALETISLVWMPAKDALVPNLVPGRWLVTANSLALFTTYGVFPLGALAFSALVGVGDLVSSVANVDALSQENLALWIDTCTFLVSAFMVSRVRFPRLPHGKRPLRLRVVWEELVEGLRYMRNRGEVTLIMRSIAGALAGGAVVFSLGAPYTTEILDGGAKGFGLIVAVLGTGMGIGVLFLGFFGDRLPKAWVSAGGVIVAGVALVLVSIQSILGVALVLAALLGAAGGVAYATGFAMLQERVEDAVRGRIFASVQVVIRVSLFVSLVAFPALANLFATDAFGGSIEQGIRLSIALGGLVVCATGALAAWDVYRGRIRR